MIGDPRDRTAYRIAITMLGLAFVVVVAGMCVLVAEEKALSDVPEAWILPAAIGGLFIGTLIPFSTHKRTEPASLDSPVVCAVEAILGAALLAVAAIAAGAIGALIDGWLALAVVGAALGGVFFGLFIPSPGRRDP